MNPLKKHEGSGNDMRPLLAACAVTRIGSDTIPGRYDSKRQVWVLDTEDGAMPIIECAARLAELVTKTKVQQEQDDPGDPNAVFLENSTKTFQVPERDDVVGCDFATLLELATKTEAQPERDD